MEDRATVATRFRTDMRRLLEAVNRVSLARRDVPMPAGWTIKEMLAHVAAWDREVATGVDDVLGERAPRYLGVNQDDFNAQVVEASARAGLDEVLAEAERAQRLLLEKMMSVPTHRWSLELPHIRWPNGDAISVASLFEYRFRSQTHYGGHALEVEEWLAGEGD